MGAVSLWSSYTEAVSIKRRIKEFLLEKKQTNNSFYDRNVTIFPFSKQTFYSMIDGDRIITSKDLVDIAAGFKMSVERLTGKDTELERKKLHDFVESNQNIEYCIQLSRQLLKGVLSASERFDLLIDYGRAFYRMESYEAAHSAFQEAHQIATKLYEKFADQDRLFIAIIWIGQTSRFLNQHAYFEMIISDVEDIFTVNKEKLAQITHMRGVSCWYRGDLLGVRRNYVQALELYKQVNDFARIRNVLVDIGLLALRQQNYTEAKERLRDSMKYPSSEFDRLKATKNLVLALYNRGEIEEAIKEIQIALPEVRDLKNHELEAKFLLLLSHFTDDPYLVEPILVEKELSQSLVREIADYLTKSFLAKSEYERAKKYSKLTEQAPFLDKEGF